MLNVERGIGYAVTEAQYRVAPIINTVPPMLRRSPLLAMQAAERHLPSPLKVIMRIIK